TVEHVHVHEGGQAIVGNVESRGGGFASKAKEQPQALTHAPGATMPGADAPRQPMPVACDEERSLPDARRAVAGRPEREQERLKARPLHGAGYGAPTGDCSTAACNESPCKKPVTSGRLHWLELEAWRSLRHVEGRPTDR